MLQIRAGFGVVHGAQRAGGVNARLLVGRMNQRHERVEGDVARAAAQRVDRGQMHVLMLVVHKGDKLFFLTLLGQLGDFLELVSKQHKKLLHP